MRRIITAFLLLGCIGASTRAHADSSEGGAFIMPGYGARAWGMSGAVIARIDDESAVEWNPAGLTRVHRAAGLSYVELVPESFVNQAQATFVTPFRGDRDAETGVVHHAAGAMYTNLSADLDNGQTYQENHLRLAYAWSPQPLVSFGVGGQAFMSKSDVDNFDAWGTAVDFAVRLSISHAWSAAVVGRDVFSRYSYEDNMNYQKDPRYVVGLARHDVLGVDLEADVEYVHEGWDHARFGAETEYLFGYVALRGGMTVQSAGDRRNTYSFGASARAAQRFFVHYAANLDEEDAFGTMHRFSLAVGL